MKTIKEALSDFEHDLEQGYIEEVEPGKYQASRLGMTQKRLELATALITTMVAAAQQFSVVLTQPAPKAFTLDELYEKECGDQALTKSVGQYL